MTAILVLLAGLLGGAALGYAMSGLAGVVPGLIIGLIIAGYSLGDRRSLQAIAIGVACGVVTLIVGIVGPLILWPDSGIAPVIGIILSPIAFLVGTVIAFLVLARSAARANWPRKIAFFTTFAVFVLLGINISLVRYMWTPLVPILEDSRAADEAPMPEVALAGVLGIWTVHNPYWVSAHGTAVPREFGEAVLAAQGTVKITALEKDQFRAALATAVAEQALPDIIGGHDQRAIWNGLKSHGLADQFVRITGNLLPKGSHGSLVGRLERLGGILFLNTQSPRIELAREVLLATPTVCPDSWVGSYAPRNRELELIVERAITAFVANDTGIMNQIADQAMLAPPPRKENPPAMITHGAHVCALWGNDRLQLALVDVVYDSARALGQLMYVLALRKSPQGWRVLAAAPFGAPTRKLVFGKQDLARSLRDNATSHPPPTPATLLAPSDGEEPAAEPGTSYGTYRWRPSASDGVLMEVFEIACRYRDGRPFTRLAPLMRVGRNPAAIRDQISESGLGAGSTSCLWRIWSVADTGEIAFSEVYRLNDS